MTFYTVKSLLPTVLRQMLLTATLWALCAGVASTVHADTRVVLRPEMVINETALGDASLLVDEQDAIGDPASGKGTRPERPFFPGWPAWQYPVHVVLDLKAERHLTRLFLYNETGEHALTLATGKPYAWKGQEIALKGYRQWSGFSFPSGTTTRYLRLTLHSPTSLPELALYADDADPNIKPVPPRDHPVRPAPVMDRLIGTNAFIDDPLDKLALPVGFVREYHNWRWDNEAPDRQTRFQPSGAAGGNSWFFDDYYAGLLMRGVTVCPALQQSNPAYFPGVDPDFKPVENGKDAEDPASYAIHASHLYQYAARYGGASLPDSNLKLGPGQPRKSGLKSLRYLENWNEPDKTWRGREGRFAPFELAAMCSADYDGDQGRMGKTVGVRNADPHMQLVLGGLAGIRLEYLKAMKLWADVRRSGDFPADVINLHHYSSDGTDDQGFKTTGISPEADHMREKFAAIVAWRNLNVPKCEVWVTEFGYDTNPKSPLHAPAIGSYAALEVQAIWLVRSYLALAAAGVDRAAMFMFRDVKSGPDAGGVFETCGMVTEKGQWRPKPSYFYIATLKRQLTGMQFAGEMPASQPNVTIYRFVGPNNRTAYLLWCPTSEDRRVPDVVLSLPEKSLTRIDFATDHPDGIASSLTSQQGKIRLEVREKPIIILAQ